MKKAPAISVIIPMYNAEKYIGDCLESLLAQTFQDFEVIIVDDCSTDSSCAVVESYAPKFNGRLKLVHTEENSGTCAIPRNRGLPFSRGEYVFFIDIDDLLTLTALEELHTLAKDFDADVIHFERFYEATSELNKIYLRADQTRSFVKMPTLDTDDLATRVHDILDGRYGVTAWSKMVKRDFIIEHNLTFPPFKPSEDLIWNYGLIFYAKKFLRVPNIVYIWRQTENSIMRVKRTPEQEINFWLNPVILGIKIIENMLSKIAFFRQNPLYFYAILDHFVHYQLHALFNSSLKLTPNEIYTTINEKFEKNSEDYKALISFLFADLITQQKTLAANRRKIAELEAQLKEKFS